MDLHGAVPSHPLLELPSSAAADLQRSSQSKVAEALARGATVLTASPFAARWLNRDEERRQRASGAQTWTAPTILHWEAWTQALWQRLQLHGLATALLMNPTQERSIARACVLAARSELATRLRLGPLQSDPAMASVTDAAETDTLAELALAAWQLLCHYGSWTRLRQENGLIDLDFFRRWCAAFDRRCREERLLSPALLERELARLVPAASNGSGADGILPPEIVLVGFETSTPAEFALEKALLDNGVALHHLTPAMEEPAAQLPGQEIHPEYISHALAAAAVHTASAAQLVYTEDEQAELRLAARWLRNELRQKPEGRFALLTCNLDVQRWEIDRVLRDELSTGRPGIFAAAQSQRYELAGGTSLAQQPAVRTALDLLQWIAEPLPFDRIHALLLSPFFASAGRTANPHEDVDSATSSRSEREAIAAFDAYDLRRLSILQPQLSLQAFRTLLRRSASAADLTRLQRRIEPLIAEAERQRSAHTRHELPSVWAERIHRLLRDVRWNAEPASSSFDFQLRRRWESSLDQLASLDFDDRRIDFAETRTRLAEIVSRTRFAPEWTGAPVQVLDVCEAAGCDFDAVWVLGAGEQRWLPRPSVSPLLPRDLARQLGLPGANGEQHAQHARRISGRVLRQATNVVVSYAHRTDNGEQELSPLLSDLPLELVAASALVLAEDSQPAMLPEQREEIFAPPLADGTHIQGGVDVLRAQAACSFQAFAKWRLKATDLETRDIGWGPQERGQLLHIALDLLWEELQTSTALHALASQPPALDFAVKRAVTAAIAKVAGRDSGDWEDRYLDLQHRRLQSLLKQWIEQELTRPQEFVVRHRELRLENQAVGPLRLSITVDRIDEVEDGLVLLDYKSGVVATKAWEGERLDDPQLPIYAAWLAETEPTPLAGMAFASVRAGESKLLGYGDAVPSGRSPVTTADLGAQIDQWRDALLGLAVGFASGRAIADPKQFPNTCLYCAQRLLCRVDPNLFDEPDFEQDGSSESSYAADGVSRG
jgi:ATP-dependent helicase/nuclease subunit B